MYENALSISLPMTLKSIGNSALEECKFWNVYLPEGLETLGDYALAFLPFRSVSLPSTIKSIGNDAFSYCEDLESVGCYAANPPSMGNGVFSYCGKLEAIYVQSAKVNDYKVAPHWSDSAAIIMTPAGYCGPNGFDEDLDNDETQASWEFEMATHTLTITGTKMGQYNRPWESSGMGGTGGAFNPDNFVGYPIGIYHVVIGEGIVNLPASSFYMEIGITDLVLPSTLVSIGIDAFGECWNLETITCNAVNPPALATAGNETSVFYDNDKQTWDQIPIPTLKRIVVPAASIDAYKAAPGWSVYAAYITDGTSTSLSSLSAEQRTAVEGWYTLDGKRLQGEPSARGFYIHNGKKIIK